MIKSATNAEIAGFLSDVRGLARPYCYANSIVLTHAEGLSLIARINAEYHDRIGTEGAAGLLQEQRDELLAAHMRRAEDAANDAIAKALGEQT